MGNFFFCDQINLPLQILILLAAFTLHLYIIVTEIKKHQYITIKGFFFVLNLFFIVPFFLSISCGQEGFAKEFSHGFSLLTFYLYFFQVFMIALYWSGAEKLLSTYKITYSPRFVQTHWLFYLGLFLLLSYFILYFVIAKPGLYYFLTGDIEQAKAMRIISHIGNVSEAKSIPAIFNYLGLVKPVLLICLTALFFYLNNSKIVFFLLIVVAFATFSKGAIAGFLVYFFITYMIIRKPKKIFLKSIIAFGVIISLLSLYITISSHVNFEKALSLLFLRFYNNTSSTYGQLAMFDAMGPFFFSINDWGIVGDLLNVDRFIPKEEIYPYIFPTHHLPGGAKGQAGSFLISELYMFSGHTFVITLFFAILVIELINKSINDNEVHYKRPLEYYIFVSFMSYMGVMFAQNYMSSPFNLFNPLLFGLRIEVWLWILLFLLLFKIRVFKRVKT